MTNVEFILHVKSKKFLLPSPEMVCPTQKSVLRTPLALYHQTYKKCIRKKTKEYQAVDVLKEILVGNDVLVIDVRMPIVGDDVEDAGRDNGRGKVGEPGVA